MDSALHVHRLDAGLEVLFDLLLVPRLGVNHVPTSGPVIRADDFGSVVSVFLFVDQAILVEDFDLAFGSAGLFRLGLGSCGLFDDRIGITDVLVRLSARGR